MCQQLVYLPTNRNICINEEVFTPPEHAKYLSVSCPPGMSAMDKSKETRANDLLRMTLI